MRLHDCFCEKQKSRTKHKSLKTVLVSFVVVILIGSGIYSASALILSRQTPRIKARLGSNNATIDTIIYQAGVPVSMNGLLGVSGIPTVSSNNIPGGNGTYTLRVTTDVNARDNTNVPLTATFRYDSSTPLACLTPTYCGTATINFDTISWIARDSDVHNAVFRYDNTANQVASVQTDLTQLKSGIRHRNQFQFTYDNNALVPAGIYEGIVTLNGTAN